MKPRSTTPISSLIIRVAVAIVIITGALGFGLMMNKKAEAKDNTAKIKQLEAEIKDHESKVVELNQRSDTLASLINQLSTERSKLSASLSDNEKRQMELNSASAESEKQLQVYQDTLGHTLADLYVADTVSPLEVLASSGSITKYIDQQTYRETIQTRLQQTIGNIKSTKDKIATQQAEVKKLIADQQNQKVVLAQRQADQQNVLATTQGSEQKYAQMSAEKAAEKKQLQEQQQVSISDAMAGAVYVPAGTISQPVTPPKPSTPAPTQSSPSPSSSPSPTPTQAPAVQNSAPVVLPNGGYPSNLANCYIDSNAISYGIDPWGYGCRQCVSYTAWKVLQKTGRTATYWGNANQWPASAKNRGYQTGTTPRAGSVGVLLSGPYGHVVWVESINPNGTINISQYNYWLRGTSNGGWGWYSEFKNVSPSAYQVYIYI